MRFSAALCFGKSPFLFWWFHRLLLILGFFFAKWFSGTNFLSRVERDLSWNLYMKGEMLSVFISCFFPGVLSVFGKVRPEDRFLAAVVRRDFRAQIFVWGLLRFDLLLDGEVLSVFA